MSTNDAIMCSYETEVFSSMGTVILGRGAHDLLSKLHSSAGKRVRRNLPFCRKLFFKHNDLLYHKMSYQSYEVMRNFLDRTSRNFHSGASLCLALAKTTSYSLHSHILNWCR